MSKSGLDNYVPSLGGGCVISITVPYFLVAVRRAVTFIHSPYDRVRLSDFLWENGFSQTYSFFFVTHYSLQQSVEVSFAEKQLSFAVTLIKAESWCSEWQWKYFFITCLRKTLQNRKEMFAFTQVWISVDIWGIFLRNIILYSHSKEIT